MRSEKNPEGQKSRSFIEEARRAQIIVGASETLVELGYVKASLAEIAKRLGVSKGVILYHFGTKDALMEQIVIELYTRGAHLMLPKLMEQPNAMAMLRTYLELNLRFIADNRTALLAVGEILMNHRKPDGQLYFDIGDDDPQIEGIRWILNHGQETREFRMFDTWVMAVTIRATIDRAAAQYRANPDMDWDAFIREATTTFEIATAATTT